MAFDKLIVPSIQKIAGRPQTPREPNRIAALWRSDHAIVISAPAVFGTCSESRLRINAVKRLSASIGIQGMPRFFPASRIGDICSRFARSGCPGESDIDIQLGNSGESMTYLQPLRIARKKSSMMPIRSKAGGGLEIQTS